MLPLAGEGKRLVYDAEGRIQRAGYSLCLLERLQDSLRRRDLWLENSERWGNPRQKLLQGKEWQAQRVAVCRALGHPTDGRTAAEQLANQLDKTWKAVSTRFDGNEAVSMCHEGKYPSLTIGSLEKLDKSSALTQLSSRVKQLLPPVDSLNCCLRSMPEQASPVSLHTSVNQRPEQKICTSVCVPFCWPRPATSGMTP